MKVDELLDKIQNEKNWNDTNRSLYLISLFIEFSLRVFLFCQYALYDITLSFISIGLDVLHQAHKSSNLHPVQ